MEVYTTEPGVQVYTSNWHNGFEGAHGATFPARSAICFEAQHFPDTPNKGHFPSCVLHPGETYNHHLFKLTHTENELAGYDLVAESLTNLSDTERNLLWR